jgi:hypothetical protein
MFRDSSRLQKATSNLLYTFKHFSRCIYAIFTTTKVFDSVHVYTGTVARVVVYVSCESLVIIHDASHH